MAQSFPPMIELLPREAPFVTLFLLLFPCWPFSPDVLANPSIEASLTFPLSSFSRIARETYCKRSSLFAVPLLEIYPGRLVRFLFPHGVGIPLVYSSWLIFFSLGNMIFFFFPLQFPWTCYPSRHVARKRTVFSPPFYTKASQKYSLPPRFFDQCSLHPLVFFWTFIPSY